MGSVYVDLTVGTPFDGSYEMAPVGEPVLVDTGAAHTVLPATLLHHLGIEPRRTAHVVVADLREVEWGLGVAEIAFNEQSWPCPVYFCPTEQYLIEATTLETFGLMVDPHSEELIPRTVRVRPI